MCYLCISARLHLILSIRTAEIKTASPIHCEAQLLATFHGLPAMPYIGVSKLSCSYCDAYFQAYRDATKTNICTRGTHGQTGGWTCPTITGDSAVEGEVRKRVESILRGKIRKGWSDFTRPSLSPQSTTASREDNGPLDDTPWGKLSFHAQSRQQT
ncbi:hypothetical protein B0H17DRAFT_924275 [Mycena rosella]|uniref:Uncharacterized protein n=1 Tax=Mycena rosella TaxID=1033263 RepID=A0AAD7DWR2_MYCRO|nr:hypothetical protein B0H17DRAFT_924275 [Mycena rosella]